jgi:hypothetical protein
MSSRTQFLSKLIGLYCILVPLAMILHKQAALNAVTAILHDSSIILVLGIITLGAGLGIVLGHNVWSGGGPALVVTEVGWISLVKGLLLLFLPAGIEAKLVLEELHYVRLFYFFMAIALGIGVYLTYSGFTTRTHKSRP